MATAWASVELPPLPMANSRPPPAKDRAMARAQSASRAASRWMVRRRSSTISAALSTVERRTWSSTASMSDPPEYRNG
jgi:hypothetical protein